MNWWKKLMGTRRHDDEVTPKDTDVNPKVGVEALVAFQPHNDIEKMLIDAAKNDKLRAKFQRTLLEAMLYAATPDIPEVEGSRTAGSNERLSLLNVLSPDGTPIAAIFTAQERIVDVFGMGVGFVAIRGEELLTMVAGGGAWLNPGLPYSVYWTSEQLSALLGRPVQRTVRKETKILLGSPSNPPSALITELKDKLSRDSRVLEAWFALAHWPDEGTSTWYLDVRTELAAEDIQGMLADTFKQADLDDRPLDVVTNKPGGPEGVGIRLVPAQTH